MKLVWGTAAVLSLGGASAPSRPVLPVLAFPEPGVDDIASYQGYQTRFYRDSKGNTVQIYLEPRGGRAVLVWADAANESVGFTVRDATGRSVPLEWGAPAAEVSDSGSTRTIAYRLRAPSSTINVGWFLLGTMRVERDFVYAKRHLTPFSATPFRVAEESLLVAAVGRLPRQQQQRHLALLNAADLAELRARLVPTITAFHTDTTTTVRVERPSLDGRNHLALELRVDSRRTKVQAGPTTVSLRTRPGSPVSFAVRVSTDATPLTPLSRQQIFNREFLDFLNRGGPERDTTSVSYRRLERQVRGVELLSSEEKLMAGLPNFATYFGRDMMMTALMMRPIWSPEMSEHVITSVLRKLGPRGDVSHEEALGGQAIRENAVIYDSLITRYQQAVRGRRQALATQTLERARDVLQHLQRTRENYYMIDDEFQLPVLAALYLADSAVAGERKRKFLLQPADTGQPRLRLLLGELALVAQKAAPYAQNPRPLNLVSFPKRDASHWRSASWRDSDAGYAGGRFAMDINVIWVPHALESIGSILSSLGRLGFTPDSILSLAPEIAGSPLGRYARESASLDSAISTWRAARRYFAVKLSPAEIRQAVDAKLAWLRSQERTYWRAILTSTGEPRDSLSFLALSLDASARPIRVVNTDPATELFLDTTSQADTALQRIGPVLRPYPVGLLVENLGPLVANDAYASRQVWERFEADQYHGPRVVWGREVNLLLLGLANHISQGHAAVAPVRDALHRILTAVNASGLQHNELWSYQIKDGKLTPVRYGTSSDVQLWNTTNLVVQFMLSRLPQ